MSFTRLPPARSALAMLASTSHSAGCSLFVCVLGLHAACGDSASREPQHDASTGHIASGDATQACQDTEEGTSCGTDAFCVQGSCTPNTCGDGVRHGAEECDDGNQETADGCTPSCRSIPHGCGDGKRDDGEECDDGNWYALDACSDACTLNECGNEREDGSEECDDGNAVDDDACSNVCTENRCRNGRIDPGEECDDGNRIQDDGCTNACVAMACGNERTEGTELGGDEECDDGNQVNDDACSNSCTQNVCGNARIDPGELCDGDTAVEDCSDDCQTLSSNNGCAECRAEHCSDYLNSGIDLVAGCVEQTDPVFRQECTAVVDCAHTQGCGFAAAGAIDCFCGSVDVGACQDPGAANGPCQAQFFAAARTDSLAALTGTFSDLSLPLGVAFYLLECERDACLAECGPD